MQAAAAAPAGAAAGGGKDDVEDDQQDQPQEVILALSYHASAHKLGFSSYNTFTNVLGFAELFMFEEDVGDVLHRVQSHVLATTIVVSADLDESLVDIIRGNHAAIQQSGEHAGVSDIEIIDQKPVSFNFKKALIILQDVKVQLSDLKFTDVVDIYSGDNSQLVCAAGALLNFLEEHKAVAQLDPNAANITVHRMQLIQLEHYLYVSPSTLKALQVFDTEVHPSRSLGASGKEGFSVFGCLQETINTRAGVGLLREWCVKPTRLKTVIQQRLDVVELLQVPRFADYIRFLCTRLRGIKDIRKIYLHFRTATSGLPDWTGLCSTLTGMIKLIELVQLMVSNISPGSVPRLLRDILADSFMKQAKDLVQMIQGVFNLEVSAKQKSLAVRSGVDDFLDQYRTALVGLPDFLTEVAVAETTKYKLEDVIFQIIYRPQVGYLVRVISTPPLFQPPADFDEYFVLDGQSYYKNETTRELDSFLGDLKLSIRDIEVVVTNKVEAKCLEYESTLFDLFECICELDVLVGFSKIAQQLNLVRPDIRDGQAFLTVEQGRHFLQEITVDTFVPNDFGSRHEVSVLTGPNASGKSVFLKQVGLIVYLAHIGCFVPADKVEMGIFAGIMTRIQSTESVSSRNSSFASDLAQVHSMMRNAKADTLLLIDEFGKGTNAVDGMSLLTTTINFFARQAEDCPLAIVTTHYSEIFALEELATDHVKPFQMDVMLAPNSDGHATRDVVPLFKIVPGMSMGSFGFQCALASGIEEAVVARAQHVARAMEAGEHIAPIFDNTQEQRANMELVQNLLRLNLGESSGASIAEVGEFVAAVLREESLDDDAAARRPPATD